MIIQFYLTLIFHLAFFEWLKMEDIFGSVYDVKCDQEQGSESPDPSGQKYSRLWKYLIGGSLITLISKRSL